MLDVIWIDSEYPENYLWILAILIVQYFFTEYRAKYWPVSVDEVGLEFQEGTKKYIVPWNEISSIREFPEKDFQPIQWSQAMFSSGSIIYTKSGEEFVVYKKLSDYGALISACNENT
ncbi:hypothetical protein [Agaribacterium sp. ZY112]|uniref:hypothetical protein n=1 Tax=Agaribacterium sp. ZY112 TaxID=3233574 RepID=UPI0035245FC7